jgi:chromosome segregation ATPase
LKQSAEQDKSANQKLAQAESDHLERMIVQLAGMVSSLEDQTEECLQASTAVVSQMQEAAADLAHRDSEIVRMRSEHDAMAIELEQKEAARRQDIDLVKEKDEQLVRGMAEIAQLISAFVDVVSSLERDTKQCERAANSAVSELQCMRSLKAEQERKIGLLQQELQAGRQDTQHRLSQVNSQFEAELAQTRENLAGKEEQIASLQAKIGDLETEKMEHEAEILGLRGEYSDKKAEIITLKSEISSKAAQICDMDAQIQAVRSKLDAAVRDKTACDAEILRVCKALEDAKTQLATAHDEISATKGLLQTHKEQVAEYESQIARGCSQFARFVSRLEEDIDILNHNVEERAKEVATQAAQLQEDAAARESQIQEEVNVLKNAVVKGIGMLEARNMEFKAFQQQVEALVVSKDAEIALVKQQIETLGQEGEALVREKDGQIDEFKEQVKKLREESEALLREKDDCSEQVKKLREESEALRREKDDCSEQVQKLTQDCMRLEESLAAQVRDSEVSRQELENKCRSLTEELLDSNNQVDTCVKKLAEKEEEFVMCGQKLSKMDQECQKVREELLQAQKEFDQVKHDVIGKEERLKKALQELENKSAECLNTVQESSALGTEVARLRERVYTATAAIQTHAQLVFSDAKSAWLELQDIKVSLQDAEKHATEEHTRLQAVCEELRGALESTHSDQNATQRELNGLTSQIEKLKGERNVSRELAEDLQRALDGLSLENESLEKSLEKSKADADTLRQALQKEEDAWRQTFETVKKERDALRETLKSEEDALKTALDRTERERDALKEDLRASKNACDLADKEIKALKKLMDDVHAAKNAAEESASGFKTALEHASGEKQALSQALDQSKRQAESAAVDEKERLERFKSECDALKKQVEDSSREREALKLLVDGATQKEQALRQELTLAKAAAERCKIVADAERERDCEALAHLQETVQRMTKECDAYKQHLDEARRESERLQHELARISCHVSDANVPGKSNPGSNNSGSPETVPGVANSDSGSGSTETMPGVVSSGSGSGSPEIMPGTERAPGDSKSSGNVKGLMAASVHGGGDVKGAEAGDGEAPEHGVDGKASRQVADDKASGHGADAPAFRQSGDVNGGHVCVDSENSAHARGGSNAADHDPDKLQRALNEALTALSQERADRQTDRQTWDRERQGHVTALTASQEAQSQLLEHADARTAELQATCTCLKGECDDLRGECDALRDELTAMEKEAVAMKDKLGAARREAKRSADERSASLQEQVSLCMYVCMCV